MRDPFEKANVNLILDMSLTSVRAEDMPHIEMFARLKISNWARRLWTYHDDAVANSNNFNLVQFQDRSIDILRQEIPVRRSFKTMSDAMAKFQRSREVSDGMKVADLGSVIIDLFDKSERFLIGGIDLQPADASYEGCCVPKLACCVDGLLGQADTMTFLE